MIIPVLLVFLALGIVIITCCINTERFEKEDSAELQDQNQLFTFMKQQRTFSPCSKYIRTTHFPYMEPLYVDYENPYYEPIVDGKPLSCKKGMFRGNTGLFPLFNPDEIGNPWIHIGVLRDNSNPSNILMLYRRLIDDCPQYVRTSPAQMMKIGDKCTVEFRAVNEATNQEFNLGTTLNKDTNLDGKSFKYQLFKGFEN